MERRKFIQAGGVAALGFTAGCLGNGDDSGNGNGNGNGNGDGNGSGNGGGNGEGEDDFPTEDIFIQHPYGAASTAAAGSLLIQERNENDGVFPVDIRTEERTGGGGIVGVNYVNDADPDGYTLGDTIGPSMILQPLFQDEATYEPTELSFIGGGIQDYGVAVVNADSDIDSADAYIEALQDGAQVASVSPTSSIVVSLAVLGSVTGQFDPQIVLDQRVGFDPGDDAAAVVRGDVALGGVNQSVVADFIESGDLKVAFFLEKEDDLPDQALELTDGADTLEDLGLSDDEIELFHSLYPRDIQVPWYGPPEIPEDRLSTLQDGFMEIFESDEWGQSIRERNLGFPAALSGDEVQNIVSEAVAEWEDRPDLISAWR